MVFCWNKWQVKKLSQWVIILVYLLFHQILSKLGKWGGHLKANMMYYHIYLYHGIKYNYYCVITQTLQNGQTLGQFFELLYVCSN